MSDREVRVPCHPSFFDIDHDHPAIPYGAGTRDFCVEGCICGVAVSVPATMDVDTVKQIAMVLWHEMRRHRLDDHCTVEVVIRRKP